MPENGFDDQSIQMIVNELSAMDSNNFGSKCGVGEREGRVICDLVKKRHYNFAHGIGRSGDILENQPKAVGASILSSLTNELVMDFIKFTGVRSAEKCMVMPMATGMSMMMCLLTLKSQRTESSLVLWSRIDQKSCFKCILTANLIPVLIEPVRFGDELQTNASEFEDQIKCHGPEKILCIISTTSCFAPRACDSVVELAELAKKYNIPHIINNAYGLQSTYLTHQIEQASRTGNVDLVVQSTDKNLLVPVGGSIIFGKEKLINYVAQNYPGRASISQSLDIFMTLLSLGRKGYLRMVKERKELFEYLRSRLESVAEKHNEKVLVSKNNPISVAMTLGSFDNRRVTLIGSMLFKRGVMGARVVSLNDTKSIGSYKFKNWGSHYSDTNVPYLTAAAGIGIDKTEIDEFIAKLDKVLSSECLQKKESTHAGLEQLSLAER